MNAIMDCAQGCLIGLAVGDALGTTLEFSEPGSFQPIKEMMGGGPFSLKAGQWTDDTSMALCLADSLIQQGDFDLRDQMRLYVRWWKEGFHSVNGRCFDIGNTVSAALSSFLVTGNPCSGSNDRYSAGNGSIMRLAPIPIFYRDAEEAIHYSAESSRGTHQAKACLDSCRYLGAILWGLLNGAEKEEILRPFYHPRDMKWENMDPAVAEIAGGSFKRKQPPEIRGSGYVIHSLEAALWAFHQSSSFETGALMAVNLGEDADTTGAVFGQIAGAYYGLKGIPSRWLGKLYQSEMICDFASKLVQAGNTYQQKR